MTITLFSFSDVSVHSAAYVPSAGDHLVGCSGRWSRFHIDDIVDLLRHLAKDANPTETDQINGVTGRSAPFHRR